MEGLKFLGLSESGHSMVVDGMVVSRHQPNGNGTYGSRWMQFC